MHWAPAVSALHPDLTLTLSYEEEGCDFGGRIVYKGGGVLEDEEWSPSERRWDNDLDEVWLVESVEAEVGASLALWGKLTRAQFESHLTDAVDIAEMLDMEVYGTGKPPPSPPWPPPPPLHCGLPMLCVVPPYFRRLRSACSNGSCSETGRALTLCVCLSVCVYVCVSPTLSSITPIPPPFTPPHPSRSRSNTN